MFRVFVNLHLVFHYNRKPKYKSMEKLKYAMTESPRNLLYKALGSFLMIKNATIADRGIPISGISAVNLWPSGIQMRPNKYGSILNINISTLAKVRPFLAAKVSFPQDLSSVISRALFILIMIEHKRPD